MKRNKITKDVFIERALKKYSSRYDYSNIEYTGYQNKIKFTCPDHGDFIQTPHDHLRVKHGCPKCGNTKINKSRQLNTKEFIKRCNKIHRDKYDYSMLNYSKMSDKVDIICPKHGLFHQEANNHIKGMGCNKCGQERLAEIHSVKLPEFINRCNIIHDNIYDYSAVTNITPLISTKIPIKCKKHGIFYQIPHNHLNGYGCPKCSHNGISKTEDIFEKILKTIDIQHERNKYGILDKKELDFYLPDYSIAIEINGIYWHSELKGKNKNHHLNKLKECEDKNIKLVQITDYDLIVNKNKVISYIKSQININKRSIYARKCEVREIDTKIKSKFLNKYHLQGNDKASVKLGLFHNNRLVSVMTFCKRRIAMGKKTSNEGEYELSRFCGNFNFYVIGGASKILKYFERNYNPSKIVTYADKTRSVGNLYYKLGFKHTHDSQPNYWYFKGNYLTDKLYHRFNFRKSELKKKLSKFDPNKTEWQNMRENGWNRIWDCGNMVFEKNYRLLYSSQKL